MVSCPGVNVISSLVILSVLLNSAVGGNLRYVRKGGELRLWANLLRLFWGKCNQNKILSKDIIYDFKNKLCGSALYI